MFNDTVSVGDSFDINNVSEPLHHAAPLIHDHHHNNNNNNNQSAYLFPFPPLQLEFRSLVTSATMFAVGVLGNLIAIVVLCTSKKEQRETTFYTLVCGMAITDLLGTCFTSPVVIATYVCNRWPGGELLCHFFSFSMLFFGSAGMSILCAMAVERYLAINHAYLYSRYVDRTMARFALLGAYLANMVLCVMPSFGFGSHVRHFPGTWCFLDWRARDPLAAAYSFLYGGVMLALIAVTVMCNVAVCRSLLGMNRRTRPTLVVRTPVEVCGGGGGGGVGGGGGHRRRLFPRLPPVTSAAEIQMFWLLIFMTIVFLVCSIPLVVQIFVNQLYDPVYISSDLLAIRFASFNPILDPWVYILCRKNLLVRGCARLKKTSPGGAGMGGGGSGGGRGGVSEGNGLHDTTTGWGGATEGGRHSPPTSFEHCSNETSYASLRTTCNDDAENNNNNRTNNKSFADFAMTTRQACWGHYDPQRDDNFHPFSINNHHHAADTDMAAACSSVFAGHGGHFGHSDALLQPATVLYTVTKMDIVSCNFSTPSSRLSEKCL